MAQVTTYMQALAAEIRAALARKGWSQARLEEEAGLPQGSASRILAGRQKSIWPQTLHRLAVALEIDEDKLAAIAGAPTQTPPLEDLPGFLDAAMKVARLEPHIPMEVFEYAKASRIPDVPSPITVEFLQAYVRFLAEQVFRFNKSSAVRTVEPAPKAEAPKRAKRRR